MKVLLRSDVRYNPFKYNIQVQFFVFCDVTMMLLRSQSLYISTLSILTWLKVTRTATAYRVVRTTAARNKHCEKWTLIDRARSTFRNAYFLQPLFWQHYAVAVLVTLSLIVHLTLKFKYKLTLIKITPYH